MNKKSDMGEALLALHHLKRLLQSAKKTVIILLIIPRFKGFLRSASVDITSISCQIHS